MRNLRAYLVAETIDHALELVHGYPGRAAFLGGGTCLARLDAPDLAAVLDLAALGLDGVEKAGNGLRLGATLPLERLCREPLVRELGGGLLAEAAGSTRSPAWRNQATLAGRLREADPADRITAALLVLEARVELQRSPGARPVELALLEALAEKPSSLFLAVRVPELPEPGCWLFALEHLALSALDAPIAAILVGLRIRDRRIQEARVATSGLAPRPRRAPAVEAALIGHASDCESFAEPQRRLRADIEAPGDHRATREYREHLAQVLLARALGRALRQAPRERTAEAENGL